MFSQMFSPILSTNFSQLKKMVDSEFKIGETILNCIELKWENYCKITCTLLFKFFSPLLIGLKVNLTDLSLLLFSKEINYFSAFMAYYIEYRQTIYSSSPNELHKGLLLCQPAWWPSFQNLQARRNIFKSVICAPQLIVKG